MHIKTRKVPQPGWNLEYLMWMFTRLSGLFFFLTALIGLAVGLFMGARFQMDMGTLARWMFFPNPNHVIDSNIPDVLAGWSNGFWQIMQIAILFFAATHGLNGLRVVLEDYITRPFWRGLVRFVIFSLWAIMLLVSIYVVLAS